MAEGSQDAIDVDDPAARVQQLFTIAVDRQVAEHRELTAAIAQLNRNLLELGERVDTLDRGRLIEDVADFVSERLRAERVESAADLRESLGAQTARMDALLEQAVTRIAEDDARRRDRELDELRSFVERVIGDLVDKVRHAETRVDAVNETLIDQADALRRLAGRLEELASGVDTTLDRTVEHVETADAAVRSAVSELLENVANSVRDAMDTAHEDHIGTTARLRATGTRLDALTGDLSTLADEVRTQLESRERRFERERRLLLSDLVEQLSENLSARQRRKLAARVELPELPAPPKPAPEKPAPLAPRLVSPPVDRLEEARAELDAALLDVRGLGEVRRERVVEAFGSLEAIRAATDGELRDVRGIGARLVAAIRSTLG